MYYLYILISKKDKKYYIGHTENIIKRLQEHNKGLVKATRYRIPFVLVYTEKFVTRNEARYREFKLKKSAHLRKKTLKKIIIPE